MNAPGPYENEQQAHAAALEAGGPPRPGWSILSAEQNRRMLGRALEAAGVDTGRYDDRITGWLAGWEDSICAVIAGWVTRAHQAAGLVLDADQAAVILDALDVAAEHKKDMAEVCGDCEVRPDGGLCGTCEWRMHQVAAYEALANTLRETSP